MKKYFWFLLLTLLLFFSLETRSFAGNVQISNFGPSGYNNTAETVEFKAVIEWNKAWRNAFNHDAVWVFMKYFSNETKTWRHATMSASGLNPVGFEAKQSSPLPSGYDIIVPEDKTGFFLRLGTGYAASTPQAASALVKFTWDYGVARLTQTVTLTNIKFRLFAIEMVYIPEGSFMAGDSTSSAASSFSLQYGMASSAATPAFEPKSGWPINSESPIRTSYIGLGVVRGSGPYYYYTTTGAAEESATGEEFVIPSEFPKGYKAFYLMKTEISQGQYRDFLNTLVVNEATMRCAANATARYCDSAGLGSGLGTRQGVRYVSATAATEAGYAYSCAMSSATTPFDGTDDGEWVAMNYLSWMDLAAYLDWAALRPITELEFEKAARGPIAPVLYEYPWGTSAGLSASSTIAPLNSASETPDRQPAHYIDGSDYPIRVGAFAKSSAQPTRVLSGAGYYGNLDLAGNVWEMVINVGTPEGRNFQGSHGDGFLFSADNRGKAENPDWPGWSASSGVYILSAGGVGLRGGSWNTTNLRLRTSDRVAACSSAWAATRTGDVGGRGGRTAPTFAAPTKPQ